VKILKAHDVVAIHRTLPLQTEDVVQIGFPARHKGTSRLLWLYLKTAIELSDVMLAQKAIGRLQGGAPRQLQIFWQAALPGGEVALVALRC
jgi:hypothetical protein